jgi:hypothetical protein
MSTSLNANQKGSYNINAPPHSLKDSNASPKVKTIKEKGIGVHSLMHNTLGVEGCAGAPKWGLK